MAEQRLDTDEVESRQLQTHPRRREDFVPKDKKDKMSHENKSQRDGTVGMTWRVSAVVF